MNKIHPRRGFVVILMALGGLLLSQGPMSILAAEKKQAVADWPEITDAERQLKSVEKDPEADAVVLRETRDGRIVIEGRYLRNLIDYHWRLKVLNERGKRFAEVHIASEKVARAEGIEARTIKPDGTIVPVPSDQIFEKLVQKGRGYKVTEFVFNFPAVEPGAILEYRYKMNSGLLIYIQPWDFANPEFTLLSRMSQAFPGEASYRVLCTRCSNPEPQTEPWQEGKLKGKRMTFEMKDVPATREELWMPPESLISPRVEMVLNSWAHQEWEALGGREGALFSDWDSVARWVRYFYQKAYKLDEVAVRQAANGWSQGLSDPAQKARAIYRHVQEDFKYVPYSRISAQTRSIADILKSKSADNEEKAVLLLAALRSLGIPANFALVVGKDSGMFVNNFYSLSQFSHVIVALPQPDNSAIWLDPTVTYAPFGFLPWQDWGAGALYMTDTGSVAIYLPKKDEVNTTRYQIVVKPRTEGKTELEVVAEFQGEDAIEMRQDLVPASESARATYLQDWLKELHAGAELKSSQIEDLDALEKPLRIKINAEAADLVTKAEDLLLVRSCVLDCEDANPLSRGERAYPFQVNRGWSHEEAVTIVPPAGMKAAPLPKPTMSKTVVATHSFTCTGQADGSVQCTRRYAASRGQWPPLEQGNVRKMFDAIVEADRTSVAFQQGPSGG